MRYFMCNLLLCLALGGVPAAYAQAPQDLVIKTQPFPDCVHEPNAANYAQWGVRLVENCKPTEFSLESLQPVLGLLLSITENIPLTIKIELLYAIREQVQALASQTSEVSTQSVDAFVFALDCDINQLEKVASNDCLKYNDTGRALPVHKWQTKEQDWSAFKAIYYDVLTSLSPACPAMPLDPNSDCHRMVLNQLIPILEWSSLMYHVVIPAINRDIGDNLTQKYRINHLRWRSYSEETGFQFPWELALNKRMLGGFHEISVGQTAPSCRLVALHPTAGLYHDPDLPDGSETDLLGVVKVLGFRSWKYGLDNRPQRQIGLSLTATFADLAGINDVGYGILIEYNGFSLGVSRHGDQHLTVMNVELNTLLRSLSNSFQPWQTLTGALK